MTSRRSQAWKSLERETALRLGGKRVVRYDLFESATDVVLEDMPDLSIDCKHRARWAFHSLLEGVERKYHGTPILVTKARGEHGAVVSCPLDYFAGLLAEVRAYMRRSHDTRTT